MFFCCCKKTKDEDVRDETAETQDENISHSLSKMFYNRIGKVEKFKHGSTVMFLGKAVLLSTIILLLVQFIANTETCYLHTGVDKLPSHFQKILLDKYKTNSLRCPYNDKFDVSYTFNLADNGNNTENVTAIKINIADIVAKKHSIGR